MSFYQQPPPPPYFVDPNKAHNHSESFGPVIGVLAVIAVLAVVAGIVGRLCSGRTIMGYGHYDLEGWIERKCASCIDGNLEAPPAPRPRPPATVAGAGDGGRSSKAAESSGEA